MSDAPLPRILRRRPEDDANTSSPQRLSRPQLAVLDDLEHELVARVPTPAPPRTPEPLSAEATALVNRQMIEKAEAFRDETLRTFDERRKAADKACQTADEVTARMVEETKKIMLIRLRPTHTSYGTHAKISGCLPQSSMPY
jgi:hypothetical protein